MASWTAVTPGLAKNSTTLASISSGTPAVSQALNRPNGRRVRSISTPNAGSRPMSNRRTTMKATPTALRLSPRLAE